MGATLSSFGQMYPPKPKWTPADMPDLAGKVVVVTGGNTGIGKETVKALLQHNAKVYLAARSPEKAQNAINELKEATGKEAIFLQLDLSDLPAVRKAADEFLSKEKQLHILFNNAGVMVSPKDMLTAQGYDLQIGTNVIGHHLFTKLLIPALLAASEGGEKARVVFTSSSAAYMTSNFHFDWAVDGPLRRKRGTWELYADSKFGNVVDSREFGRRYGDKIVSISLNPGNLKSDLQRYVPGWQDRILNAFVLYPTHMGAITQLWGGTSSEGADFNGKFLGPWARVVTPNPKTQDTALGEKLWDWLEEQTSKY